MNNTGMTENLLDAVLRTGPEYLDSQLVEKNKKLEKRLDTAKQKIYSQKQAMSKKDKKIKTLNTKIDEAKAQYAQEIQNLKEDNKESQREIHSLERKIKRLESQKDEISREKEEIAKKYEEALAEKKEVEKALEKKEREIKYVQEQCDLKIKDTVNLNPTNSSIPSSQAEMSHAKPQPPEPFLERPKGLRKRGAQKGHAFHGTRLYEKPDEVISKTVKKMPQGAVRCLDGKGREYGKVQEWDLERVKKVKEIHYYEDPKAKPLPIRVWNKYKLNPVAFSDHFKAILLYERIHANMTLGKLHDIHVEKLPQRRKRLFPCFGSIRRWEKEFEKNFTPIRMALIEELLKQEQLQVDETGGKCNGKKIWFHVLCTNGLTVYYVTFKRGDWEEGPLNDLKDYHGRLVSDHFVCYFKLDVENCECLPHYLRHLKRGVDTDKNDFCLEMIALLYGLYYIREECEEKGEDHIDFNLIEEAREALLSAAQAGIDAYEKEEARKDAEFGRSRSKKYIPKYLATLKRFVKDPDSYLRWAYDFSVPFSNNLSERLLRKIKGKKRASGQFVSMDSAKAYVDILTCITNAQYVGISPLKAIEKVLKLSC